LSVSRGEALIKDGRIVVMLNVWLEDLVHLYALAPADDGVFSASAIREAATRYAADLSASFKIWDGAGEELAGSPFQSDLDSLSSKGLAEDEFRVARLKYEASYALKNQRRFLSFRFSPVDGRPGLARQFAINVHGVNDPASRTIPLTSRGNVETVEVEWRDSLARIRSDVLSQQRDGLACTAFGDRGPARFREAFVDVNMRAESIVASISVPLALLETWMPVPRRTEGALDPQEQQAVSRMARSLMESALLAESGGTQLPCELVELEALGAAESAPPAPATTIGFFSSRLQALLRCSASKPLDSVNFRWKLLNSSVLSVPVAIHSDGRCEAGEFSTYQPKIEWQRRRDQSSLGR